MALQCSQLMNDGADGCADTAADQLRLHIPGSNPLKLFAVFSATAVGVNFFTYSACHCNDVIVVDG